jgi:acetate---CoA ligase (ADP-forming)
MTEESTDPQSLTPVFKAKTLEATRARARASRQLDALFAPAAIAVVGASARPGSVGQAVFRNLLLNGYTGTLYPVNPRNRSIMGVKTYPSVLAIEDPVDMAILIIPAAGVPEVIAQCAQKQIHSAIVISAGFKETGPEGAALETRIRQQARDNGLALLGPNCLGLINTDPAVSMNASFARAMAQPGNIAFMSQSGALCTAILDYASSQNIGFSKFISFGNKADIDENDLLRYLGKDPQTQVILMYVEDLSHGLDFIHIARQITSEQERCKPILALKSGRTAEGARAAASHTGSMAGTDEVYDAVMAQAGVLRVDTVQELFDYAMAFANQPMPASDRVAIVTNAGGPGIMATDACVRQHLKLAELSPATRQTLTASLPAAASVKNPVDVLGDARHDRYQTTLEAVLQDDNVDGVIVILTPQNMTDIEAIAQVVAELNRHCDKPILASFMGGTDVAAGVRILRQHGVPHYPFPEGAARVFRAMRTYKRWLDRPRTEERIFEVDRGKVQKIFTRARQEGRTQLPELEAMQVLEAYGFPVLKSGLARQTADLEELGARIGFPLVMKIASPDILHKTEVGGVEVGVPDLAAARQVFEGMVSRARQHYPQADIWGVNVQQLARPGREVILGATRDPKFGPLVMFGLGGIYTEALKDVTFRLAPLRQLSARHMLEQIRGRKILEGIRGEPPADFDALQECLERLSQLVIEFPVVEELDINPLIAYGKGAVVADARIILED